MIGFTGSILQIEPDTNLNPIAFHPQQSLYLVSNQMCQEKLKFHTTTTTI